MSGNTPFKALFEALDEERSGRIDGNDGFGRKPVYASSERVIVAAKADVMFNDKPAATTPAK